MFRFIVLSILLAFSISESRAQSNYYIEGVIANKNDKKAVSYATISLIDSLSKLPKSGIFSDEKGHFKLDKISNGNYYITVQSIGYKNFNSLVFKVYNQSVNLDTLFIETNAKDLKEVEVVATKPILEIESDKLIYNVENDPTLLGQSAIEALKKLPFVTVDGEDNIQLKGSSNFKVLLNGKSTGLVAKNPSEALKSFPANLIKKIEVITEPSAKYDADGTTGIINIITMKKIIGYNGHAYYNYTNRITHNFGGSLNVKRGKMGFSTYFGGHTFDYVNQNTSALIRENKLPGHQSFMNQLGTTSSQGLWQFSNSELAFDFDTLHSLSIYASPNGGYSENSTNQNTEIRDSSGKISNAFVTNVSNKSYDPSFDLGLDFTKLFKDNNEHELSLCALRQTNISNTSFNSLQNYLIIPDLDINNENKSKNTEYTFNLDYEKPLKNKRSLEAGSKLILRHLVSEYTMMQRHEPTEDYVEVAANTNVLKYDQNVGSLYSTYSFFIKDYKFKLGARAEQTWINAKFNADSLPIENHYLNFIPTTSISRKIKKSHNFRLNYSKRIQRPWMYYLNPYVNNQNPRSISFGNPNLLPEKTHNVSLSWNHFFKQKSLDISLSNSFTNDVITSYSWIDSSNISYTSFFNIAKSNTVGLNVSFNGSVFKKMNVWLNYGSSYINITHKMDASRSRSGFSHRGHGSATYNFKYGWSATIGGSVHQAAPTLQSKRPLAYNYNFGVRKAFLNKKLTFGIVANNFLESTQTLITTTSDPNFYSEAIYTNNIYRYYNFSVSYNFGKLRENVSRKKGLSNDDKKSGD